MCILYFVNYVVSIGMRESPTPLQSLPPFVSDPLLWNKAYCEWGYQIDHPHRLAPKEPALHVGR